MVFSLSDRSSGVLLHLSSLPGPYYNGDLGPASYEFVDFLKSAGQRWWQMLPVNPIGPGFSPYSTISSFAGESLYISLDLLVQDGWLKKSEVGRPKDSNARSTNYLKARKYRSSLLKTAHDRASTTLPNDKSFKSFCLEHQYWLNDYLLFRVICDTYKTPEWQTWPSLLRERDTAGLKRFAEQHTLEMQRYAIEQYWFFSQWSALKNYANKRNIGLIGDLPIFVSDTSADVWSNRKYFQLGKDLKPTVVAGCPPDAFNKDGQLWGNALYDWQALKKDRYGWWLKRLGAALGLFDAVRLDHFIGFYRYWEIKAGEKTARNGRWMKVPGEDFFNCVTRTFKNPQFIAEDLGAVTPEIRALRDKFGFPGMKVSQFAFDGSDEAKQHMPHLVPRNSVAYTGTHDNDTTKGWLQSLEKNAKSSKQARKELEQVNHYLNTAAGRVSWDLIRVTMASQASVSVFPMQDLLAQSGKDRMNVPGVAKGNWQYRVEKNLLSRKLADNLVQTTQLYSR